MTTKDHIAPGSRTRFGTAPDGSPVWRVGIADGGLGAAILSWGAALQDLRCAGHGPSLVLGGPDLAAYLGPMENFGVIVGRVANRVAGGRAPLDGRLLDLERNEAGMTALHGGSAGSGYRNWQIVDAGPSHCTLDLSLESGSGGYPGALAIRARYRIAGDGAGAGTLTLDLEAETDAPTFCNLAHHGYWTLDPAGGLGAHRLTVSADRYLPTDAARIPAGAPAPVAGTRFDFRNPRRVLMQGDAPLDHCFCLRGAPAGGLRPACSLAAGALVLEIETTEPGLQVYDGAMLATAPFAGHDGAPYGAHAGLALEPQGWPDAPNRPDFPSVLLRPGETYRQTTRFRLRRTGPAPG
ncbi:MAG: galactose mutarotase [Defluviimonas sp.]|uniref:aldose epimerase family protein n=1 Tax=Albidovulum sp. TaxID=1872424 RepID=UPI001D8F141D|nr:galactose mutarotase [Paracoccaceae bacterium]MCC0064495.1 galactose mutarotase [Defluviimonas sp.]